MVSIISLQYVRQGGTGQGAGFERNEAFSFLGSYIILSLESCRAINGRSGQGTRLFCHIPYPKRVGYYEFASIPSV